MRSQYNNSEMSSKKGLQRGWYEHTLDSVVMAISTSERKMVMMLYEMHDGRLRLKAEVR